MNNVKFREGLSLDTIQRVISRQEEGKIMAKSRVAYVSSMKVITELILVNVNVFEKDTLSS